MSTKHTPGPWIYELSNNDDCFTLTSGDKQIIGGCGCCGSPWCVKVDAQLIAAAPDLLEALKAMVESVTGVDQVSAVNQARAAIAKATGDTQ